MKKIAMIEVKHMMGSGIAERICISPKHNEILTNKERYERNQQRANQEGLVIYI